MRRGGNESQQKNVHRTEWPITGPHNPKRVFGKSTLITLSSVGLLDIISNAHRRQYNCLEAAVIVHVCRTFYVHVFTWGFSCNSTFILLVWKNKKKVKLEMETKMKTGIQEHTHTHDCLSSACAKQHQQCQ